MYTRQVSDINSRSVLSGLSGLCYGIKVSFSLIFPSHRESLKGPVVGDGKALQVHYVHLRPRYQYLETSGLGANQCEESH